MKTTTRNTPMTRAQFIASPGFEWLAAKANGWQFGEQGILDALLARLSVGDTQCVEIGAGDGAALPLTCARLVDAGWHAQLWEADGWKRVGLAKRFPTAEIRAAFDPARHTAHVPAFPTVMVIDVDGTEAHILAALLAAGVLPIILVVEHMDTECPYTPRYPWIPPLCMAGQGLAIADRPGQTWCLQATHAAILAVAGSEYTAVGRTRVNTILVRNALTRQVEGE